ncbi:MAG: neutral zinc metallopeptidase [Propionibacteriaceae bacterium]|nr:neutral zinc metallopeptidase [Propionibacteriaceae bacterium]
MSHYHQQPPVGRYDVPPGVGPARPQHIYPQQVQQPHPAYPSQQVYPQPVVPPVHQRPYPHTQVPPAQIQRHQTNPWPPQQYYQQQAYPPRPQQWTQVRPPQKKSHVGSVVGWSIFLFIGLPIILGVFGALADPTTSYNPSPRPTGSSNDRPSYPTTEEEAVDLVRNHPLYNLDLEPTDCQLPRINVLNSSPSTIQQHMEGAIDCLMEVWGDELAYDDYVFKRPALIVYEVEITAACGVMGEVKAAYCAADNSIYISTGWFATFSPEHQRSGFLADKVVAHEFSHAIQAHTRILSGEWYLSKNASSQAEELEFSRRLELQAQCFAGLSLNSLGVTSQGRETIENIAGSQLDTAPYEGTHGTSEHYAWWIKQGLNSRTVSVCNTFIADAELVS